MKKILLIIISFIFIINIWYANDTKLLDRRVDMFCNSGYIWIASEWFYLYNNEYILKEQWDTKKILLKTQKLLNKLNNLWLSDLNKLKENDFFNTKLNKILCIDNKLTNDDKLKILDNIQKYINWRESIQYRINDYYIVYHMKHDIKFFNQINSIMQKYNIWNFIQWTFDEEINNKINTLRIEIKKMIEIKKELLWFGIKL